LIDIKDFNSMLLPYLKVLNNKKIILGSQSKTRKELLNAQRIVYQAIPSKFAEDLDKSAFPSPADYNLVPSPAYSGNLQRKSS
jgi:hypothetical protein